MAAFASTGARAEIASSLTFPSRSSSNFCAAGAGAATAACSTSACLASSGCRAGPPAWLGGSPAGSGEGARCEGGAPEPDSWDGIGEASREGLRLPEPTSDDGAAEVVKGSEGGAGGSGPAPDGVRRCLATLKAGTPAPARSSNTACSAPLATSCMSGPGISRSAMGSPAGRELGVAPRLLRGDDWIGVSACIGIGTEDAGGDATSGGREDDRSTWGSISCTSSWGGPLSSPNLAVGSCHDATLERLWPTATAMVSRSVGASECTGLLLPFPG
mmetsp:Transcript_66577/g.171329  ORF Transcript_66577/g.171329 Transcript_66577/m.171329 type:complete len:273 (+) Transcript_66577:228-1046(+)